MGKKMQTPSAAAEAVSAPAKATPEGARISYVIGRLELTLRRYLADGLSELGVTLPQYTALSVLRRRGALSNAQLARRVLITPQSTIKVIAALEKKGLITRVPDPDHGRILRTLLTPAGHDLLEACDRMATAVENRMLESLGQGEREQLAAGLRGCLRSLGAGVGDH